MTPHLLLACRWLAVCSHMACSRPPHHLLNMCPCACTRATRGTAEVHLHGARALARGTSTCCPPGLDRHTWQTSKENCPTIFFPSFLFHDGKQRFNFALAVSSDYITTKHEITLFALAVRRGPVLLTISQVVQWMETLACPPHMEVDCRVLGQRSSGSRHTCVVSRRHLLTGSSFGGHFIRFPPTMQIVSRKLHLTNKSVKGQTTLIYWLSLEMPGTIKKSSDVGLLEM